MTEDIRPEWLNVVRRFQSVARTQGCAIITLRVAVTAEGTPVCWAEPVVTKLEPKATCRVDELLAALTDG